MTAFRSTWRLLSSEHSSDDINKSASEYLRWVKDIVPNSGTDSNLHFTNNRCIFVTNINIPDKSHIRTLIY